MKHCLLPVDWPIRTGKQCFSENSTSFAMRRKQWHARFKLPTKLASPKPPMSLCLRETRFASRRQRHSVKAKHLPVGGSLLLARKCPATSAWPFLRDLAVPVEKIAFQKEGESYNS
jgi:hypothetical protein